MVQGANFERETSAVLFALSRELAEIGEPSQIAQRLASAVPLVVDADASVVVLFDHERGVLTVEGLWGWPTELAETVAGFELPLDASPLIDALIERADPVYVTLDVADSVVMAVMQAFDTDAALIVPLSRRGEVIGLVAAVKRGAETPEMGPELTQRLQGLAACAGTAIDNATLYHELQEQLTTVAAFEERYRLVSEITSDVAYAYATHPGGRHVVEWSTEGIERISGYTGEEALALGGWPGLVIAEDADVLEAHAQRVLSGQPSTAEFRIRTKSGEPRWLEISDTPMDAGSGAVRVVGAVRDIHERRTAQQRLSEREAQLLEAQVLAEIGNWHVDLEMNVRSWSDQIARIFGWTEPQPPPPEWVMSLIHPGDLDGMAAMLERAVVSREPVEYEYRIVRPDGAARWLLVRCEVEVDEAGAPIAYKGTTQDVTERRNAEEYRRVIAESVSDAAFSYTAVDGDLVLDWVSDAWTRLTGYPSHPTPRQLFAPIAHVEDADLIAAAEARVLAGERTVDEFRVRAADGSTRWLRIYAIPVLDPFTGAVDRVYGAAQDVSERRRAEEALAANEAHLRQLIDASPLAVAVFEPSGRATLLNPAAEEMFGFSLEEVQAMPGLPPWVGSRQVDDYATLSARVRAGERVMGIDTKGQCKDGSEIDVSVSLAPLAQGSDQPPGVIAVMADITERIELEEELRQAQKMNAIGRLAGGVAHDFNNILTTILGHAEFLLEEAADAAVVRDHAEAIRVASERAAALTEQMLMMSRHRTPVAELINLNDEVAAMRDMLSRLIGEHISFELALSPDPCVVRVARTHVHQILLNLIVNARDAMPRGGTVRVETASVRERGPGDGVVLRVVDDGEGMGADLRERVFEPFFTTRETGVGLGLSVVYGIVQSNHGEITVDSRPGHGATFELTFPASSGVEQPAPSPDGQAPRAAPSVTVLLVEDEPAVRAVTAAALARRGYQVTEAANPDEALHLADDMREPPHLLVTDLVMPGMNGGELAARLRERWPGLPILFISGYSESAPDADGPGAAGTRFLQKPFVPETLLELVRDLIEAPDAGSGLTSAAFRAP